MSWHLPHRLTRIHQAVSITLLCSVGSAILLPVAQAATLGKTVITSAQHEPLAASISVSNINAADFVANIASPAIYQQMGLTPTASMSVRFVATSATTGQVLISTSQPVSMPFADVVLAVNDNGQRNMVPKTLLMPLGGDTTIKQSNRVIAGAQQPNLPLVTDVVATPLAVKKGAPPPLMNTARIQAPLQMQALNTPKIAADNTLPAMTVTASPSLKMSPAADMPNLTASTKQADAIVTGNIPNTKQANLAKDNVVVSDSSARTNKALNTSTTDRQLDILNIQVTRQIQLNSTPQNAPTNQTPTIMAADNELQDNILQDNISQENANVAAQPTTQPSTIPSSTVQPMVASNHTSSYTVQRNDNLWIISQQIAKQNNIDVQTVMAQIKAQNPEAFISQDADLLKADAKLNLPSYEVVPSQQNLQTAIAAQRQYYVQSNSSKPHKNKKKLPAPKDAEDAEDAQTVASKPLSAAAKPLAQRRDKPTRTVTKTLPQAQFSVIAPGRNGSADGTQSEAGAATGNGLNTDILATLNSARQRTADQAKRVTTASSALGKYTKRLQLQNQKLADLQARLKKLRNQ
ncbi:FimV family protein [uncultured Psychrobacter sp.]|uniref:type IV pilus assembly protein FimV n=1 Tax=uncultured Psychrobacter sp. TaxID=259303 RepID=UPI00345A4085